jgi:hypothetical protein
LVDAAIDDPHPLHTISTSLYIYAGDQHLDFTLHFYLKYIYKKNERIAERKGDRYWRSPKG